MECVIRFSVSSTITVLLQFKEKLKKPLFLKNGEFYQENTYNKKDVEFNFISDIFYEIFCIFNQYRVITIL